MTYQVGNTIVASDYTTFTGATPPNVAYLNDAAAQYKVSALIGVGYGQRGYGQTSTVLPTVTSNSSIVTSTEWNNLRSVMSTINTHTGSGLTLQPVRNSQDLIVANDGTAGNVDLPALVATLDSNRMNLDVSQASVSTVLTSTRTTSWTNSVYHEFYASFGSEDLARYFFNTGGEIRLAASRTGGSSSVAGTAISNMLTDVGTVKINATSTTSTGTGGTTSSIGYYDLTSSYQTVFTHFGSGMYANVSYVVTARRENYVGANGANGSLIRVRATVSLDGYTTVTVDGTLVSTISNYKSAGAVNSTSPTYATTVNL